MSEYRPKLPLSIIGQGDFAVQGLLRADTSHPHRRQDGLNANIFHEALLRPGFIERQWLTLKSLRDFLFRTIPVRPHRIGCLTVNLTLLVNGRKVLQEQIGKIVALDQTNLPVFLLTVVTSERVSGCIAAAPRGQQYAVVQ